MKWSKKVFATVSLIIFCFSLVNFSFNTLGQQSIIKGSTKIGIIQNSSVSYSRANAYNYADYYSNKYCHDGTYRKETSPYYGYATCSTLIDDSLANSDCAHFVSCAIGSHNGYCSYSNSYYPGGGLSLSSDSPSSGSYGECNSVDLAQDLLNNGFAVSVSPVEELEQSDVIIYNYGGDNFFDNALSHHCVFYCGNYKVHAHSNHTSPGNPVDWWSSEYLLMPNGGANTAIFFKIGYEYAVGCWVRIPYFIPGSLSPANIRDTPGGNLLGTADRGAIGRVVDGPVSAYYGNTLYQWYKVTFESGFNGSGWVTSRVLRAIEDPHLLSVGDRVQVNSSVGLYARTGPGLKESGVKVPNGTQGTVIQTATYSDLNYSYDDGYTWVEIQWDGGYGTGWSAQYYLEKISSYTNPSVTTNSATNITQTSATLNATVNPNGDSTYAYFQWGLTTSYGNTTTAEYIGSGTSNVSYSKSISGLSPNTTYHFRVVAYDTSYVNIYGSDMTFTTPQGPCTPPSATTNSATNITYNSATLNATVNPNGLATTVWFQYGTTTSYGSETTHESIGSGTSNVSYSKGISGLSPNTTYHFRVVASSSCNTTYGSDMTFTTPQGPCTPPSATTNSATFLGNTSNGLGVVLHGEIIPNGQSITGWFQYGTTTSYGLETSHDNLGTGSSIGIGVAVYGLSTGITYHFRIVAQSQCGTAYGNDMTFILSNNWESPTLSSGSVSPSSGDTSTIFTYLVNYYDPQGFAPAISDVYIDGTPYPMVLHSGIGSNGTYMFQSTLPGGSHNYYFQFSDGLVNTRLPTSGTYSGPNIFVPPTVHLTYPNGGETLTPGSTINVTWTISGDLTKIDHISVDYSTDGGTTWTYAFSVSSGFSASMSKSWTVPNVSSTNCKLRVAIKRTDGTWSTDLSDGVFTIAQSAPTVHLTYPNGGETLTAGSAINVTWTISGDLTKIDHISVDYSTDGGTTWTYAFSVYSGFSASMSRSWTVPNVSSTNCKLRVALKRTDGTWSTDLSDSVFTIQAP